LIGLSFAFALSAPWPHGAAIPVIAQGACVIHPLVPPADFTETLTDSDCNSPS
jgi:hypothetical protein